MTLTLEDSPEMSAMRREVVQWARDLPEELRWRNDFESLLEVDRRLAKAGLLGITWPKAYGGRGTSPLVDAVVVEELREGRRSAGAMPFAPRSQQSRPGDDRAWNR